MRLLTILSQLLPIAGDVAAPAQSAKDSTGSSDRMLHARLQGTKLGVFDIYFDSAAEEQVQVGQARSAENGEAYYDEWTSFSPARGGQAASSPGQNLEPVSEKPRADFIAVRRYVVTTEVNP